MLNKAYGGSAYKIAKPLVEGCRFNGGESKHIKIKKLFIVGMGEVSRFGNRSARFQSTDLVRIKYPYDKSWLIFRMCFGEKYLQLIKELIELAKREKISYGVRIVFRKGEDILLSINTGSVLP